MFNSKVGEAIDIGIRDYMEDRCGAFALDAIDVVYIADGHGGSSTVQAIHDNVREYSKMYYPNLHQLFGMLDDCACAIQEDKRPLDADDGSTLVIAFVHPDKIVIAHCGDSKAFVFDDSNGSVIWESKDHDCNNDDEVARIAKHNAIVFNNRVMGVLTVTRAIGDKELKPYGVVCTPDVAILPRSPNTTLVLSSDGLWAGQTQESFKERLTSVMQSSGGTRSPQEVAASLMLISRKLDNTCVLVQKL